VPKDTGRLFPSPLAALRSAGRAELATATKTQVKRQRPDDSGDNKSRADDGPLCNRLGGREQWTRMASAELKTA